MFTSCDSVREFRVQFISDSEDENKVNEMWMHLMSSKNPSSIKRIVNFIIKVMEQLYY